MKRIAPRLATAIAALLILGGASMPCRAERPNIFVTEKDLPRLRQMARDKQTDALGIVPADAWAKIKAKADSFVAAKPYTRKVRIPLQGGGEGQEWVYTLSKTPPPPHNDNPKYPVWTSMFQERDDSITTRLRFFLTACLIEDNEAYYQKAKEIVMALCAWPGLWTDPQYGGGKPCLDTGHCATWVGIFYDWSYQRLTPDERDLVRKCLAEKALAPAAAHVTTLPVYHNFNTVLSSGLVIGGLALLGEDDRAKAWVDLGVDQIRKYMDAQGKDGGPMEGPLYGTYAGATLADVIWALQTAKYPTDLTGHPYLKSLPRYCIAMTNPDDYTIPTFGDGGAQRTLPDLMRVLALQGDGAAAWYCIKIGALEPETPRGFLALDPARIVPQEPKDSPSDCFIDIGAASLRDGFKPGTAYMAFKAGPPASDIHHNHFDHNSFQIEYMGNWIAGDPGYRNYYEAAKKKYTLSTFGHNSIVLDPDEKYLNTLEESVPGHDQVRKTHAQIAAFFTSPAFDYVRGEAADAYNPAEGAKVLDRFAREIVFVKPDIFFLCDTLAAPAAHTYGFMLHLRPSGRFQIDQNAASVSGRDGQSVLRAFLYSNAGPMRMTSGLFPKAETFGPYFAAITSRPAASARIAAALIAEITTEILANPGFEDGMNGWKHRTLQNTAANHKIDTEIRHGGKASARIDRDGYYYSNNFQAPVGARVHARFWARVQSPDGGGASTRFYFWKGGKSFKEVKGPRPTGAEWKEYTFATEVPEGAESVSLALNYAGDGSAWYDDADIRIEMPGADAARTNEPTTVTPIGDGTRGIVCKKNGRTHIMLCGEPGVPRTEEAAGHKFTTDASLAVVTLGDGEPGGFAAGGKLLEMDGKAVTPATGIWRAGGK